MNPWDNFLMGLAIGAPAFIMVLVICVLIELDSRKLPSSQFSDERYEDGFYIPKEQQR